LDGRLFVHRSLDELAPLGDAWDELAVRARSPFLSFQWLRSWWKAFAKTDGIAVALMNRDRPLGAGACFCASSGRLLTAAANQYSECWDVVAVDDSARKLVWRGVADLGAARLRLPALPATSPSVSLAPEVLRAAGYRIAIRPDRASPYLTLPGSWEALLRTVSKNLRAQVRQSHNRLQREGSLAFRTTTSGSQLERDLNRFLLLEGSGWKGRAGSAIRNNPRSLSLFTDFARAAARRGWLRLHFLELDGVPIAADYSCVFGGGSFMIKTAFDERYARLSPGLALRAEAIRAAIDEGLDFYDFGGQTERYKLRWTGELHERVVIEAYRGLYGLPAFVYRYRLRPLGRPLRRFAKFPGVVPRLRRPDPHQR
jgi:CelD/BcsL family acetyltransferase involved in cellulose biosynthesis